MSGVIGHAEPRRDGVKLATGRGTFTDDISVRGLLHGYILTSPHAHARIVRVNAARARAMPGVAAVLTFDDGRQPASESTNLLHGIVRFAGDRVALIAAEDPDLARRAAEAVDVHYDPLPAVIAVPAESGAEARAVASVDVNLGDVQAAFAEAELVVEGTYRTPRVAQCAIEPQVVIAWLDEDQRLVVRTSNHAPFAVRHVLAERLGLALRRIRVVGLRDSGSFGGRIGVEIEDLCAVLAQKTGRAVRLAYTREQELVSARAGHPATITIRSAIADGRLTALDASITLDAGAASDEWPMGSLRAAAGSFSLYRYPNVRVRGRALASNLPPAGAMRGDGAWQAHFALESHMDEVAKALDEDALDLRRRHLLREGDTLATVAALADSGRPAPVVRSCGLEAAIGDGARAVAWTGVRGAAPDSAALRRGVGMALAIQTPAAAGVQMTSATVDMLEDGSFQVFVGSADVGAGTETVLCQIAAEALDTSVESIVPHAPDTDVVPFASGPLRASALYGSGLAVRAAAQQVRAQVIDHAARLLMVSKEEVVLRGGAAHAAGRRLGFDEIGRATLVGAEPKRISGSASHALEDTPPPSFAAVFADVLVDVETGIVRVVRLVEAVDCGQVLNPQIAEVRITGGALQGTGMALSEAVVFDEAGRALTRSLRDYRLPSAGDVPEIKVILVPTAEPFGPYGAKSLAEVPLHAVAAAIANAIANAVGARVRDLPLTPERILAALGQSR